MPLVQDLVVFLNLILSNLLKSNWSNFQIFSQLIYSGKILIISGIFRKNHEFSPAIYFLLIYNEKSSK